LSELISVVNIDSKRLQESLAEPDFSWIAH
jgi:hypothetical protein